MCTFHTLTFLPPGCLKISDVWSLRGSLFFSLLVAHKIMVYPTNDDVSVSVRYGNLILTMTASCKDYFYQHYTGDIFEAPSHTASEWQL